MTEPVLANAIMDAVLAAFRALPKTGKPQPNEYTVLAGWPLPGHVLHLPRPLFSCDLNDSLAMFTARLNY
jgi:hypothetical protein